MFGMETYALMNIFYLQYILLNVDHLMKAFYCCINLNVDN